MTLDLLQVLASLLAGIAVIILLTAKYRVHAFFALFLACFVTGLCVQLPVAGIIAAMKEGFGNIMRSLGFIIVLGTTLGVLLEHSGSTRVMAASILRLVGERYAALAMNITGIIVGLPVFCDSGYIVLSGLNQSLARRTRTPVVIMAASLASGLYAMHCLIPPHPGATAAAGVIGADFGRLILMGILVAVPAALVGCWWAHIAGRKIPAAPQEADTAAATEAGPAPSAGMAFMPVVVPIILIAAGAFTGAGEGAAGWRRIWQILGDPVAALSVGVLLAFAGIRRDKRQAAGALLQEAVEKAGGILVITGAGGAFGAVLAATRLGPLISEALPLGSLGLLFPFLVAALLKTAQGSSTVAIITAASIVQPLLPALGLNSPTGQLLCILSLGAGSMTLSHANDSYFWVISRFSGLEMKTMLKVYSVATLWMGLTSLAIVYILSLFLQY
ncbi:GntP family permease [Chitinophaga japonensis]|uniref:Putative D-glycerate permease (TC 2.A.8.1.6) n=1 Tax=Chitinophaga japonensis TaxID=104662 RepID=A0A562T4N5_CHIJA|nr:GntP family permease [Chitinophaga japonensis]TWI88238.1 putative D-glycerate permease (TC 2.A.8.1.6) [Chitinophaga japonensis]